MTARHLVADGKLTLLGDVAANNLVNAGAELVAVLSCEYFNVNNDTRFAVRQLEGCVANVAGLFAEDRAKQSFFCGELGFTLGCNLTNENIACANLGTLADNTVGSKILECIFTDIGDFLCDLFRTELGIT